MICDQMIDLTMQVVMQFLEWMDNCKIFYIDPQKCIQYGGMSIVEDERYVQELKLHGLQGANIFEQIFLDAFFWSPDGRTQETVLI